MKAEQGALVETRRQRGSLGAAKPIAGKENGYIVDLVNHGVVLAGLVIFTCRHAYMGPLLAAALTSKRLDGASSDYGVVGSQGRLGIKQPSKNF